MKSHSEDYKAVCTEQAHLPGRTGVTEMIGRSAGLPQRAEWRRTLHADSQRPAILILSLNASVRGCLRAENASICILAPLSFTGAPVQ